MILCRKLPCVVAASLGLLLLSVADAPRGNAGEKQPDAVQVSVPLLPETIQGAVADPQQTAVVVVCGTKPGAPAVVLPPVADTYLWKESEKPAGSGATLVLRDSRWSQALLRIDPKRLEGDAVQRAVFRFKAGGSERPGNARLQFHRMLVDWSESATWSKPFPERPEKWNGLRPGKDYETQPFATLSLEEWKRGSMVEAQGFEKAVQAWRDGVWPNYGFLVLFWGKSLQIGIPSREAKPAATPAVMTLGGPQSQKAVLHVDLALLGRLLPRGDDLLAASLRLQVQMKSKPKPPAGAILNFYRAKVGNADFETAPFISMPVAKADKEGQVLLPGLEGLLRSAGDSAELPILLAVGGAGSSTLQIFGATGGKNRQPVIEATVKAYPRAPLLEFDIQPQPGVYCTAKDGHLDYGGRRLRLWGTVGYGAIARKRKMGFNCSRLWEVPDLYDEQSVKRGEPKAATAGEPDKFDVEVAATRKLGMFVMYAGLTGSIPLDKYRDSLLADDSFLAGGDDWPAWKKAVAGKIAQNRLAVFDERLAKLRFAHAKNLLNHRNPLTGKRLGEEEAVAVYEVWNELGFPSWALEGGLDKSPQYFRDKARARWNAWLAKQYADEAALRKAWGRLEAGESLSGGDVKLAPMLSQRGQFPEARGCDFVRFWIELLDTFNQQFRQHCRAQMSAGVGVNVAPFSFDTQYRPSIPWDYSKSLGDVNCFGMYFWGIAEDLAKPPSMYVIDSHTLADRPTVLYETNQARPNRYRSDYPQRIAALACWQDWDGVIFHYWGGIPEEGTPDERYLLAALPHVNPTHYWSGVQHAFDPVMCSSMAIAGRMFLKSAAAPAPAPAAVDVGRKAIFGFDTYNGLALGATTFARGSRIRFTPDKDAGVSVDGQSMAEPARIVGAVRAGQEIVWDWPHARLIIDTPTYKAYVGRTAGAYRFCDGLTFSDVNLPWVCFALASDDGRPLVGPNASRRMLLSAVFDARNRGFEIDPAYPGGGPTETFHAIRNRGTAPVTVDKAGYTLSFPTEITGRLEGYDFALRKVVEQSVSAGNRLVCPPRDLYLSVLTIEQSGKPAVTPPSTLGIATEDRATTADRTAAAVVAAGRQGLWNPVPGLAWGVGADAACQAIRKSALVFSSLSRLEAGKPAEVVTVSDVRLLWKSPTDLVLSFHSGRLQAIRATVKQPPALVEAVADYEKHFGPPVEKHLARQEEVSRVRWQVKQDAGALEIILTEVQGTLTVLYEAAPR